MLVSLVRQLTLTPWLVCFIHKRLILELLAYGKSTSGIINHPMELRLEVKVGDKTNIYFLDFTQSTQHLGIDFSELYEDIIRNPPADLYFNHLITVMKNVKISLYDDKTDEMLYGSNYSRFLARHFQWDDVVKTQEEYDDRVDGQVTGTINKKMQIDRFHEASYLSIKFGLGWDMFHHMIGQEMVHYLTTIKTITLGWSTSL